MKRKDLSYALAAVLWVFSVFELSKLVVRAVQGTLGDAPLIGKLLAGSGPERLAPLAVIVVFSWVAMQVLVHAIAILREQAAVRQFQVVSSSSSKAMRGTRAGRRAELITKYNPSSPERLAEALPAAAALDGVALDNGFSMLKAYVWSLPVLGFIGTAWAMAHSISGFSDALEAATKADGGGMSVLTDRLGQFVIPGLAGAFSVTMLALAASIVGHLWVTVLQSWDQDLLHDLDQHTATRLAELVPVEVAGGVSKPLVEQLAALVEQLRALQSSIDFRDAAGRLQQAAMAHVAAAEELRQSAAQVQASVSAPYHITISREEVQ
jgi:biopolymer transport protein ExbB/TolQ